MKVNTHYQITCKKVAVRRGGCRRLPRIPLKLRLAAEASLTLPIQHDLVPTDVKIFRCQGRDASDTADQIEQFLTLLTVKEMMMMPG